VTRIIIIILERLITIYGFLWHRRQLWGVFVLEDNHSFEQILFVTCIITSFKLNLSSDLRHEIKDFSSHNNLISHHLITIFNMLDPWS
jgi:hypothetical protein